jgi:hypothetical protein
MTMLYDIYLQEIQTDEINDWMTMTERSGSQVAQIRQNHSGSVDTREPVFSLPITTHDQTIQNHRGQRRLSFAMGLQKYRMRGVDQKVAKPIIGQVQRRLSKPFIPSDCGLFVFVTFFFWKVESMTISIETTICEYCYERSNLSIPQPLSLLAAFSLRIH